MGGKARGKDACVQRIDDFVLLNDQKLAATIKIEIDLVCHQNKREKRLGIPFSSIHLL